MLSTIKKIVKKILRIPEPIPWKTNIVDNYFGKPILQFKESNQLISNLLQKNEPLMITRLGSTELNCVLIYLKIKKGELKKWPDILKNEAFVVSGIFPPTDELLNQFSEIFIESIKNTDIMGVWFNSQEDLVCQTYCPNANLIRLEAIEPYYHREPWSQYLMDKKVLVIHPFAQTIENQYNNKRELLFDDLRILPPFKLSTYRSVQSNGLNETDFKNWTDAYKFMCDEISKIDFEIAIIGAGAYGLPLASYIKSIGKQAIHIGGATQILFGIKGHRWDDMVFFASKLYNEHWIRPNSHETPKGYKQVEEGSYW